MRVNVTTTEKMSFIFEDLNEVPMPAIILSSTVPGGLSKVLGFAARAVLAFVPFVSSGKQIRSAASQAHIFGI